MLFVCSGPAAMGTTSACIKYMGHLVELVQWLACDGLEHRPDSCRTTDVYRAEMVAVFQGHGQL